MRVNSKSAELSDLDNLLVKIEALPATDRKEEIRDRAYDDMLIESTTIKNALDTPATLESILKAVIQNSLDVRTMLSLIPTDISTEDIVEGLLMPMYYSRAPYCLPDFLDDKTVQIVNILNSQGREGQFVRLIQQFYTHGPDAKVLQAIATSVGVDFDAGVAQDYVWCELHRVGLPPEEPNYELCVEGVDKCPQPPKCEKPPCHSTTCGAGWVNTNWRAAKPMTVKQCADLCHDTYGCFYFSHREPTESDIMYETRQAINCLTYTLDAGCPSPLYDKYAVDFKPTGYLIEL